LSEFFYGSLCHFFLPFSTLHEGEGRGQAQKIQWDKDLRAFLEANSQKMCLANSKTYVDD